MGSCPSRTTGDSAALFCWALLLLVFIGPGRLALDRYLGRERSAETADERVGVGA